MAFLLLIIGVVLAFVIVFFLTTKKYDNSQALTKETIKESTTSDMFPWEDKVIDGQDVDVTFFVACALMAQTYKLQTYSFSSRSKNSYGVWSDWSKWEASDMLVVINQDKDRITIYSRKVQEYDIYSYDGEEDDRYGGTTISYSCVDDDGLRCGIRLRAQADGSLQLYVDYNDAMWVYGIRRK